MNHVCNRNMLRRLLIITFSALVFCAVATANETATEGGVPVAEDSRPGPLGIAVSGSSAGITTDYFEQEVNAAIVASSIFSSINDTEEAKIIMRMIRVEGVFPSIEEAKKAPYFLHIRIIRVKTPSFAMHMTADIDVIWALYRTDDKTELLHEKIQSSYTGGVFEGGIHGANRARVATEGAMRENILTGVDRLRTVDFNRKDSSGQQAEIR